MYFFFITKNRKKNIPLKDLLILKKAIDAKIYRKCLLRQQFDYKGSKLLLLLLPEQ